MVMRTIPLPNIQRQTKREKKHDNKDISIAAQTNSHDNHNSILENL